MSTSGSFFVRDVEDSKEIMQVALGREKADLVVANTRLLNVYTGELPDNYSVSIKGEWIAYVGKNPAMKRAVVNSKNSSRTVFINIDVSSF